MKLSYPVIVSLLLIVLLSGLFASCGYRFSAGGLLPGNTGRVAVTVFKNKSAHSGAEVDFTNALIREILLRSDTQVVDPLSASTVISGIIESVTFSNLSRTSSDQALERQVTAVVHVKMVKNDDIIWELKNYKGVEEAVVSSENISDEASKAEAVEKAFAKMTQKIVSKMLDDF